jgi:hypothetical protein
MPWYTQNTRRSTLRSQQKIPKNNLLPKLSKHPRQTPKIKTILQKMVPKKIIVEVSALERILMPIPPVAFIYMFTFL